MSRPQFFARIRNGIDCFNGAPSFEKLDSSFTQDHDIRGALYSDNGKFMAVLSNDSIAISDASDGSPVNTINVPEVYDMSFSPLGGFLCTWERPKLNHDNGNWSRNLKVWNSATSELLGSFISKNQNNWKFQFSYDEKYAARMGSDCMELYQTSSLSAPCAKLQLDNLKVFSLSPGRNYSVAVFVAEKSGKPGSVKVFDLTNFRQPIAQQSFFKADSCQFQWNSLGTSVLALVSTDVDKSNKSYYGESTLYLLGIAGNFNTRITLDKQGPIHDISWSPNAREFGVVYGYMPAKTTIFDARGNETYSLMPAPRNTIKFSPHARFVLVAGFGNLQGSVDIYDTAGSFRKVCTFEAPNTSVCKWSPDGRYILTATTSPRLRVDNGIRIWHWSSKLMFVKEYPELLSVAWRPQPVEQFPWSNSEPVPEPHPSALLAKTNAPKPAKPAGAYRPPHARNGGGAGGAAGSASSSISMLLATPGYTPVRSSLPPGAAPPPQKPSKNRKRRDKKNAEEGEAGSASASASASESSGSANGTNGSSWSNGSVGKPPATISLEEKKIRALQKKLRAIQQLKERQAVGETLEDTQIMKINTEEDVRRELANLGWTE